MQQRKVLNPVGMVDDEENPLIEALNAIPTGKKVQQELDEYWAHQDELERGYAKDRMI
jgi:hypothetical protein